MEHRNASGLDKKAGRMMLDLNLFGQGIKVITEIWSGPGSTPEPFGA